MKAERPKLFVTGSSGFIGGRVAERFERDGRYEVIRPGRSELSSQASAEAALKGVDAVVHCAGKAGAWGPYEAYRQANVALARTLLDAARACGVRRFVNLSSPSIYFDFKDQFDLKETDLPPRYSNAYARTKHEGEICVKEFDKKGGMRTVSLRPRFVIGAGDRTVLPRMIRLQEKGLLFQVGDGKNVIDVTSISNLLDAIELCLGAPDEAMGETYNITNGKPVEFWSLVDQVLARVGLPARRIRVPRGPLMAAARLNAWACRIAGKKEEPGLLPLSVAVLSQSMTLDIGKARSKLGYVPRQPTEEAVREFAGWWTQSGSAARNPSA